MDYNKFENVGKDNLDKRISFFIEDENEDYFEAFLSQVPRINEHVIFDIKGYQEVFLIIDVEWRFQWDEYPAILITMKRENITLTAPDLTKQADKSEEPRKPS